MIHESLQKSKIFSGTGWLDHHDDHFHNHHLDYYCKTVTTAKTDSTVSRVDWTETKSTFIVQDLLNMLIPSKQWRWHCLWLKNFCSCFCLTFCIVSPNPSWNCYPFHHTHPEIIILQHLKSQCMLWNYCHLFSAFPPVFCQFINFFGMCSQSSNTVSRRSRPKKSRSTTKFWWWLLQLKSKLT